MKLYKRLTAVVLSLMTVILLLPGSALAAGGIDPTQATCLTIRFNDGDMALAGAKFAVYQVATVDEYAQLTTTPDFKDYNVDIRGKNDEAWEALASTLAGYVQRDQVTPTASGTTDKDGVLVFSGLPQGLYLVRGERHSQAGNWYDAAPFMTMLPTENLKENVWDYAVTAAAKFTVTAIPDDGPSYVSRKVLKVWDDAGHAQERPQSVTVQLLRDGEVYDTVTLTAADNWRHTWTELDNKYQWSVVEEEMEGYTVTVTREGVTFKVTNTYDAELPDNPPPTGPGETPKPDPDPDPDPEDELLPDEGVPGGGASLPQTGQLWWPVPVLFCAGLLMVIVGLVRRREDYEG